MDLDPRQRQHLKSLAHGLQPVVQLGAKGLTPSVTAATREALDRHELIKVKLPKLDSADEREALAKLISERSGAAQVQLLGRVLVLYTGREKDLPGKPRIELPR